MRGKTKRIVQRIVDIGMTVLLLCLMAYQVTGEVLHEWCGIAMTVLLVVHHILNIRWYSSLFKGKYNALRIVTVIVNMCLLGAIALTAVCGMAMSAHAVPFLYGILPVAFARRFHLAMSYWSYIFMGVHLGLHIPVICAGLRLKPAMKKVLAVVSAVIAGYGFYLFARSGITEYIFFRTPFAFLDYDKAAPAVFGENLAMLWAFAFAGVLCAWLLKPRKNERKEVQK